MIITMSDNITCFNSSKRAVHELSYESFDECQNSNTFAIISLLLSTKEFTQLHTVATSCVNQIFCIRKLNIQDFIGISLFTAFYFEKLLRIQL